MVAHPYLENPSFRSQSCYSFHLTSDAHHFNDVKNTKLESPKIELLLSNYGIPSLVSY